jgi:predicted Zn-dependent protease
MAATVLPGFVARPRILRWLAMGLLCISTGADMTQAAQMIDRLLAMLAAGKDNMLLRYSLGKAYAEQENHEAATEHLRAALAFDPQYSVAWKWLGKARLGLDDRAGARAAWEQGLAAAQARGDAQVVKELGVFLKRLDKDAAGHG